MRYIGLDVNKTRITACVLSGTGKTIFERGYVKRAENWGLDELQTFGDKDGFCVMMESGERTRISRSDSFPAEALKPM